MTFPISNDAITLGILSILLAAVFYTSSIKTGFWSKFYTYVPSLLLCYFLPSILNSTGLISGENSALYKVASRYLLPASLILLCLSIDLKGIINLGPKALIMFFAATFGIIIGGPIALLVFSKISDPGSSSELWRGLATIAGSWIGGGANQAAMKEIFKCPETLFSAMVTVDVIVANIWMAFLLYGAGICAKIDVLLKADASAIETLKEKMENYRLSIAKIPDLKDLMMILAIGIGGTGIAHFFADLIVPILDQYSATFKSLGLDSLVSNFFWIIVIATTIGVGLSFTKFKSYEGVGASRVGSAMLYILVATIGMKMDVLAIFENPGLFLIGLIWMLVHVSILLITAKIIKAPFFFVAVGSQANVGGAASAPIVASAFSPALAPVGVLLAVLGYALGTYGALLCAQFMQWMT